MALLLLDRDGTLIEEGEYLSDPKRVRLLPGVIPALKSLKRAGHKMVVISNQSGIGRGLVSKTAAERVNRRFVRLLRSRQIMLDGVYWCPHKPSDHCACRKPKLGLVKRAAKDLGISWKNSISVGDKPSDVQLGRKTGGAGVLVRTGYGSRWARRGVSADHIATNFRSAARWILGRKERTPS